MGKGQIFTAEARVVLGDEAVSTTDDMVETTDEMVETTDEVVQSPVVTSEVALGELLSVFGPLVDADYLPGKTGFRDALRDRLDLSEVEAEDLVDAMEGSGQIRFISSEEGLGWRIEHVDQRT